MVDISEFLKSERKAYERDPEKYMRERAQDDFRRYKDHERFENEKLMDRYERMQKHKEAKSAGGGSRGGGGGGSLGSDVDIEGLPKKLQTGPKQMKSGGKVKSASARADGCAQRGKTRGKMI